MTRALLLGEIDAELARGACALDDWSVDARDGLQVDFLRLPELQPVRTVAEGRALVARWQKMGAAIDQAGANLRRGLAAGKVATADEVQPRAGPAGRSAGQARRQVAAARARAAAHPDWPAAERRAFARASTRRSPTAIRPAFERLPRRCCASEILPRARDERARRASRTCPAAPPVTRA